ncbi:MAG TPA: hypothetical protein VF898_07955 [Chloroflexota bacterium]
MWLLRAERAQDPVIEERVHRQGTAYRRARQLYMAGYGITAIQFSATEPQEPLAMYQFDGIRFVKIPRLPR